MSTKGSKSGVGKLEKLSETANRSDQSPSPQFAFNIPGVDNRTFRQCSMKGSPRTDRTMMKSASLSAIGLEDRQESYIVDQADIIDLTQDVKNFSDTLARLKAVINENLDQEESIRVVAHERLGDVLRILKNVLQRYRSLNSTELFSAAGTLITQIRNFNYEDGQEEMEQTFLDAIDQLALAFSSSVSEYLMGDLQHGHEKEVMAKSYDNLLAVSHENETIQERDEDESGSHLTVEQIDETLINLQAGLDLALQRAKAWSKYLKDLMTYIERRAQFELEYAKNLARLAATTIPVLTEEGYLPLQSIYCTVLSQDVEYAKTCHATLALLQSSKFIEPLMARKMEHDKMRKAVKETWMKEVKKMQETLNNQRKAHSMYINRQQEYEKAKELAQRVESDKLQSSLSGSQQSISSSKVDKRRKSEEEAAHKAAESETTYKACIAEANSRQQDLQKTKSQILATIREEICQCDETIKKVTIDYFQLLQTVSSAVPIQYSTLCEATKCYEPGSQYREFVRNLPIAVEESDAQEPFKFETYSQSMREIDGRKVSGDSNTSEPSGSREESPPVSQQKDKYRTPAWSLVGNETDSASGSSKSLDSSPSNSPFIAGRKKLTSGSVEDLDSDISSDVKQLLAVPGTFDPDVQGLLKHQGKRRNTTFGVDFQEQVEQFHMAVPPIITKCLKEVERRGICLKGIYRVSGVKSRVESLCQKFENDPNSVDLQDENPNVISNVLKLYLRQLPEPLLTFRLYPDFIQLAKENMTCSPRKELVTKRLQILVDGLPFSNRKTCAVLMHHLQKVASYSDQNQMNASNLGIVFGPTLLRPRGGNASLACLVDTPHQTRVVELLIVSAQILFGPADDHEVLHGETPVEELSNEAISRYQKQPATDASEPRAASESVKKSSVGSVSPTEKVPIYLPVVPSANLKDTIKPSSSEDFQLPGSTESDKKTSNSGAASTVTQSSLKALSTDGSSDIRFLNLQLPAVSPPQMSPPPLITIEESNSEGQNTLVTVVKTGPEMTFFSKDYEGPWPRNPYTGVPQIAFSSEVPKASFHMGIEPLNRKKKGILAGLFMSQTPQLSRKSSTENSQGSKGGSLPTSPQSHRATSSTLKAAMASIGSFFKSSDSSKKVEKLDSKDKPDTKEKSFFRSSSFKSPKLFRKGVSLDQDNESASIIKNTVVPENASKEKTKENEGNLRTKPTRILKREVSIDEERDTNSRTISIVRSLPNLAYSYCENEGSPEYVHRSLSFGADDGNFLLGNSVIGPKMGKHSTRSTPSPETKKSKSLSTMESIEESDVEAIESEIQGKSRRENSSHFLNKVSKDSLAVVQEEDQEQVKEQINIISEGSIIVLGEKRHEGEKEHGESVTTDMLQFVMEEDNGQKKEHIDLITKDGQAIIQERKHELNKEQIVVTEDFTKAAADDRFEDKTEQRDHPSRNIETVAQDKKPEQIEEQLEIKTKDTLASIQIVHEQKDRQVYVVEDSLGAGQIGEYELANEHIEVARIAPVAAVTSAYLQGIPNPAISMSTRPKAPRTVPFGCENVHAGKENSKPTLKSHSGPIMGKSGLHPVRGNSYDLKDIKDASQSVRSSLVSSAARMKSASKKSPVTLLSYHTATISIPPGNKKPLGHTASEPVTPSALKKVDKGQPSPEKKNKRPASFDKPQSIKNGSKGAAEKQDIKTSIDHLKSTDNSLISSSQPEIPPSDAHRKTDTKARDSTTLSVDSKSIDNISSTKAHSSEKKLSTSSSKKPANDSSSGGDTGRTGRGSTPRKSLDTSQTKVTSSARAPVVLTVQGIRKSSLTKSSGPLLVTTPSSEKSSWSTRECMKKDTSHEVDAKKLTKENGSNKQGSKVEKPKVKVSGKVSENSSRKTTISSPLGPSSCSKLDHSGPLKDSVSTHARAHSKSDGN
ncbi:hypothetical protein ACJMK2_040635 [Sinanodonta woodiana]|uniref:Uncharacterized protein n=1 Tax=Sinanodonta woodiana TaxID=1069815 RepID=A0ABD3W4H4_SINWO